MYLEEQAIMWFTIQLRQRVKEDLKYLHKKSILDRRVIVRAHEEKTRFLLLFCVHIYLLYLLCSSDIALTTLVNLCHTVTGFPSISAWDHTFTPREYLLSHLEDLFIR